MKGAFSLTDISEKRKHICAGIVAHVDAGKTTLSEALLYTAGQIRKVGRVDHGDAFLDTFALEKERGITIFSKQAELSWKDKQVTLLDTPGHVDFSAEMERTLQVLDYAILVISGADGVQGHTRTLWRLLQEYKIPTFLFINKMDQPGTDSAVLMEELQKQLSGNMVDFTGGDREAFYENIALADEKLLESFLETGEIREEVIPELIQKRKIFPCYFGSALKMQGVMEFLEGFFTYTKMPDYDHTFGAKVFKIARDEQGNRLTYVKVTGGVLTARMELSGAAGEWKEKVNQIRIYSGSKYETVSEAEAGMVCALTGLTQTRPGEGLGKEEKSKLPLLEPVLTYRIQLPEGVEAAVMLPKLRMLEEEEPELHIVWKEELQEIQAQVMGEVQIEILKQMIQERFGVSVSFDTGNIVYKETIRNCVEGMGHFEPLRHYAEVHLWLEPGEPGSGFQVAADCSEDMLDKNWQRLILTHLLEREHRGVLTGAAVTDVKVKLIAGRAHLKHTEGGDFRQATYRAVRQGLMQAESVLLEPFYEFRLEVSDSSVGRAMTDMERMGAEFSLEQDGSGASVLTGQAPVVTM
ncbi:MAG: TetM/TetW/TetO/TetS family tetracycline resistance ribosomal protection protein, partial [Roseburia sp.]|nr:TetM/TetW/TetO/TetS family tetracycline resistance ribosomal protection protein [Roseburia sp.]